MLVPSLPEGTKTKGVYAVWLKVGYEVNDLISDYTKENDGIILFSFIFYLSSTI